MFSLLLLVLIIFLLTLIGVIVFFKNPKNKINQYFGLTIFFGILWILSNYFENEPISEIYRIFFLKFDFASAILLVLFFYLFCQNFPKLKFFPLKYKITIYFLASLLFILSFSDLIIKNIYFENTTIQFTRGSLFWIYFSFILFCIGGGLKNLISKYKQSRGVERLQILYVLLGAAIIIVIATPLNLILPQVIFIPLEIARMGIYSFLFFCFFTALAITRYHLFGIEVILTEALVGAIGILLIVQIFTAPTFWWRIVNGIIFVLFCIFGYLLIRSVFKEMKLREETEKISQAKTEFISIASHQLRTPLSAIKGYLSMILEGSYGTLPEKVKEKMEKVFQSNERLIKLVNDILSVSKIEVGEMEMSLEKEDLREIIKEVISELSVKAKEKNLYLKFEEPKEIPKILIDREKIRQVILNLIDNAIRYTQEGGVKVKLQIVNNRLQIAISDTGEGLSKEEKEKLFERFSRGTAGAKFWVEGAGLGLYIAKKFVEMHKGKIWAESEGKGKGSTFFVELPIK